jgi:hypothetical protein
MGGRESVVEDLCELAADIAIAALAAAGVS